MLGKFKILLGKYRTRKDDLTVRTEVKIWSDKLTDRNNYWLNAVTADDDGIFFVAIQFYLKDVIECLNQGSIAKAALGCSCAANCFAKIGHRTYANLLYLQAAILYEQNGDSTIGNSIKASIWSLEEAYENYILAQDLNKAEIVFNKCISLKAKLDRLFDSWDLVKSMESRKSYVGPTTFNNKTLSKDGGIQIPLEVIKIIEDFLQIRKSANNSLEPYKFDSTLIAATTDESVGAPIRNAIYEKGFTS
jgi:hypothetical protein